MRLLECEAAVQGMQALDGGSGGQIGIATQAETYRINRSLATEWVAMRYGLSPRIAAVITELARLGGGE